ncbi:protein-disulfide reductase DsbD family protein [Teredinibacter purpureus]|uniref:protein-disulfide reductase DsbD family protein n=1 Tax=Teredinibacter purpureus TaxID=2731756 RepID=UPI0005F84E33|nr:protein-disulfide reductase DsbD [Teredinibacter purpureus]
MTFSYALRSLRKTAPTFLLAGFLVLLWSTYAHTEDYNFGVASNESEFLPVDQAYQVMVERRSDQFEMLWNIAPAYYLYQHQFKLEVSNGTNAEKLTLDFEPGKRKYDEYFAKELEVYYNTTIVRSPLPSFAPPYELKISSQGCADAGLCYSPRRQYFYLAADGSFTEHDKSQLTTTPPSNPKTTRSLQTMPLAATSEPATTFLPAILLGALLGGLILNLMPCVFPVLSLKALSFASSGHSGHQQRQHGWAYTVGVVGSFIVAAATILVAREAGEMLGWGFQLQHPVFVAALIYLFLVMGLNLFGMFELGTQFMGAGQSLTTGGGVRASFFTGVLAAVVASPCTAPFMATALGVALTQSVPVALLIFATLGFGMALPFLALSYSPKLANYLPQPGAWMDILKQVLAFPLLATAIWLLWVLGHQVGSSGIALILSSALLICFALWLTRFSPGSTAYKLLLRVLIVASLFTAAQTTWGVRHLQATQTTAHSTQWTPFSLAGLEQLRAEGKPVFVNFTADWCITCKVNERVAFHSDTFFNAAQQQNITLMKADWTNPNDEIATALKRYNRSGIPLYLMFPAKIGSEPAILPQFLTPSILNDAFNKALSN